MTTENERDVTRSICAALKRSHMRPTSSRIAVLRVFLDYPDQHMTAEEIFRHVPSGTEQCSLASVYRSLAQLVTAGMVISSWVGENRVVYESNPGFPHSHIVCSMCGAIENFTDPSLSDQQEALVRDRGFDYLGCNVLLFGRCTHCKVANNHSRIHGRLAGKAQNRIHG